MADERRRRLELTFVGQAMIFTILLYATAVVVSIPALTLGVECLLALLPPARRRGYENGPRPSTAVLVPAHNEELGIAATIASIREQLGDEDRLIVIADNCTDGTALAAHSAGATVWERHDDERRGKGYALRFAFGKLAPAPPAIVVCIDADCILEVDCLSRLSRAAAGWNRPVQAAYLMHAPEAAGPSSAISAFAVLVKNFVRPLGLQRVGLPCLITGSGVAYPWDILAVAPHPEGHIVEDMRFATDLALAGYAPRPLMEAVVRAPLPVAAEAVASQRTRWEHGHLSVLFAEAPRLLLGAMRSGSFKPLALALELAVPPVSLFLPLFGLAGVAILSAAAVSGAWGSFVMWGVAAATMTLGLTLAWQRFGRQVLPPEKLRCIPGYAASKFGIYRQFMTRRQTVWVRTDRGQSVGGASRTHVDAPATSAGSKAVTSFE
jgi:cellulose synthase/poly-beta-1,6-N-acetylglucosamine synthase-like glycosyltransferase